MKQFKQKTRQAHDSKWFFDYRGAEMRITTAVLGFLLLVPIVLAQDASQAHVTSIKMMSTYSQDSDGDGSTKLRQVYRLETDSVAYDVTGWENVFKAGKRPAMQIGDVVNFHVDPKHGQFIDILLPTGKSQKPEWHRFLRVGAEAKPAAN
jgi:hypothetical protein